MTTLEGWIEELFTRREPDDLDNADLHRVLDAPEAASYARLVEVFTWELQRLLGSVFVLRKIQAFPLDLVVRHPEAPFWRCVKDSLYEASIVRIHKLIHGHSQHGKPAFPLRRFKNWLGMHMKDEYRVAFKERRKAVQFESRCRKLEAMVERLRNDVLGHLSEEVVFGRSDLEVSDFPDIEHLCAACVQLSRLFHVLTIGVPVLLPVEYATVNQESDIDELLGLLLQASGAPTMPEDDAFAWKTKWESEWHSDPHALEVLNQHREKIGLPRI